MLSDFTKFEKLLLTLKLKEVFLIIPESSDSANYLGVYVPKGTILIKEASDIPKLTIKPDEKLKIIDIKTIYNLVPFIPKSNEFIPITKVEIVGSNIYAYFYINKQKEDLAHINVVKVLIKQPKDDSIIFQLRQINWQKESGNVVAAKPSVGVNISEAKLDTNLVKKLI